MTVATGVRALGRDLTGTGRLVRLLVRRDRLRLALWVVGLVATITASAASLLGVYSDQRAIDSYGAVFGDNPALVAFAGPGHGLDDPTIGAILVNETQLWSAVALALMSIFLVVRHTRAEEDAERADLVLSTPVGRVAPVAASVAVIAVAEAAIAMTSAVALVILGYPPKGVVALTGSWFVVGAVFIGVAVIAAQWAGGARAALSLGVAVLAASFVLRAVGDISGSWLVWTSPIGWAQAVRAFVDERWWTLALCAAVAVTAITAGMLLSTRRDVGAGLLAGRLGPERAAPWSVTPLGFGWRQQRAPLAGWLVGLGAMGALYATIVDDVESLLIDNPQLAEMLALVDGVDLTDAYLATTVSMTAIMALGFTISAALAPLRDEGQGRADLIYARPVARSRWLLASVAVAAIGSAAAVMTAGCGAGVVAALVLGDPEPLVGCIAAAASAVPAVFVVLGITVLLVGAAPQAAAGSWGVLAFVVVVTFLGDVLDLPRVVRNLSPFEHVPRVPAEDPSLWSAAALTAVAVALVAVGVRSLGRRDLNSD